MEAQPSQVPLAVLMFLYVRPQHDVRIFSEFNCATMPLCVTIATHPPQSDGRHSTTLILIYPFPIGATRNPTFRAPIAVEVLMTSISIDPQCFPVPLSSILWCNLDATFLVIALPECIVEAVTGGKTVLWLLSCCCCCYLLCLRPACRLGMVVFGQPGLIERNAYRVLANSCWNHS